jgi:transcriptional regulator with XRE-family HTH domain
MCCGLRLVVQIWARHARNVPAASTGPVSRVVAANVRALRARLRLRQRDVAERGGFSVTQISLIEGERRRVAVDDLAGLCRGLGVSLADLLDGADPRDLRDMGLAD